MHPNASEDFQLIRQFWIDLRVGYQQIVDSDGIEDIGWGGADVVGSALTDAQFWACQIFSNQRLKKNIELDDTGQMRVVAFGSERLTTRLLFECAATIDQFMSWGLDLRVPGDASVNLTRDALKELESEYGLPVRMFEYLADIGEHDLVDTLLTVLVLIDFALNPQIPPFTNLSQVTMNWADIYPPLRFIRACLAVKKVGSVRSLLSDEELTVYIQKLASETGLPDPAEYQGIFFDHADFKSKSSGVFEFSSMTVGELETDYISYLAWAQRKFWALRAMKPTLLTFYGTNTISQSGEAIEYLLGEEGHGWFDAPFHWTDRDTFAYSHEVNSSTATQYGISIAYYLTLHDLVSASGPFRTSFLPPDTEGMDFWGRIHKLIGKNFDPALW